MLQGASCEEAELQGGRRSKLGEKVLGRGISLGPSFQRGPRPPPAEAIRWVSALTASTIADLDCARIDLAQWANQKRSIARPVPRA